jgi:ankyrin repeat protein
MDKGLLEGDMSTQSTASKIVEAIKLENLDMIRTLFKNNPDQKKLFTPFGSQTWLGYAAQTGKLNSLKVLEDIGISIDQGDKRENRKPICSAAANNHDDVVDYLLGKGAELDTETSVSNPLFAAIVGDSVRAIKLILKAGINSQVRYNTNTMKDMDALAFSIMRGCRDGAELIALHASSNNRSKADELITSAREVAKGNA